MATIITKNSSTASSIPLTAQLVQGELAVNVADKRLFTKNSAGAVVEIGTSPSAITTSSGTITGGTINNVVIGATTPVAGSFTNLAYTGTLTGGTGIVNLGTGQLYKDAAGRLGVGTDSPSARFEVKNTAATSTVQFANLLAQFTANAANADVSIQLSNGVDQSARIGIVGGSNLYFALSGVERARIASNGNFMAGTTITPNVSLVQYGFSVSDTEVVISKNVNTAALFIKNASGSSIAINFYNGTTQVGSVATNATSTAYNTSSDYRLKNTIDPMTGALDKVALLKPCTYKWNVDGSEGQGFIAHELAEVEPNCVSGEKDAVDDEGNPKYQGIDTSFLVATLAAAIQELKAIVDEQAVKIAALEAK